MEPLSRPSPYNHLPSLTIGLETEGFDRQWLENLGIRTHTEIERPPFRVVAEKFLMSSSSSDFNDAAKELLALSEGDIKKAVQIIATHSTTAATALLSCYACTADCEKRKAIFLSLRTHFQNNERLFSEIRLDQLDRLGLWTILQPLETPLGHRQGFGVLSDFHFFSRCYLERLGKIRFLPLPARFPILKSISPRGV